MNNLAFMCVVLASIVTTTAFSQSKQRMRNNANYTNYSAVSGRISLVDVDHIGSTIGFGGSYEMGIAPQWILSLGVDYWKDSDRDFGIEVSVRDIAFGGFAKFMLPVTGNQFKPYAGGGLAIHMLKAEVESDGFLNSGSRYEDSESELGIDLGGGAIFPLESDMSLYGEIRFRDVNDEDIDQLVISFGVLK